MPYTVDLVDAISATPTVRLPLNDDYWWRTLPLESGTSFDPPPRDYASARTMLVDGARISAGSYGNRTVVLALSLDRAPDEDTAAAELQALQREIQRDNPILRYKVGTTNPVFFRVLAGDIQKTEWGPTQRRITATLVCDPAAIGPRVTLAPATVTNDPASGCYFDVVAPLGDFETPLYLSVAVGTVTGSTRQSILAVRRRGTVANQPWIWQAETMTLGTGATLPGNDALMSGAGNNYARVTFTSATLQSRLTGSFPAAAGVDVRGLYRVMARIRHSVAGDSIQMRLRWGGAGTSYVGDTITVRAVTSLQWVDLSRDVQFPCCNDPGTDGMSGAPISAGPVNFTLDAGRTSGSGTLDVDCLAFMPADDGTYMISFPTDATSTAYVLDAARRMVYPVGAAGEILSAGIATTASAPPLVTPGITNRVWFLQDTGQTSSGDVLANTTAITPSYFPLYVYVRPATT